MDVLHGLLHTTAATLLDVLPIVLVLFGFQRLVLRQPLEHRRQVLVGLVCVLAGLALFVEGLELALFPLGKAMARQLTDPDFLAGLETTASPAGAAHWSDYHWVYLFAFAMGFATTLAEPALLAVALEARRVSRGAIGVWGLRTAVALGVGIGLVLGTWRIIAGHPLHWFIIGGYVIVLIQTAFAPRAIVPLAYDSGGVTTSTVTVPMVAALGLGLASHVPGRNPLLDGFGLIAFASLFPMMTVMAHAQLMHWRARRRRAAGGA